MAFLQKIAENIAEQINLDRDSQEVFLYGMQVFCVTVSGLMAALVFGWFLNCFTETLIATGSVALLRTFAGGAHCTSPVRCTIVTAIVFPMLGKASILMGVLQPFNALHYTVLTGLLALTGAFLLAPADSPAKPISTERHRKILRFFSLAAVILITAGTVILQHQNLIQKTFIYSTGLGLLWQTFILTKSGHTFMDWLDKGLKNFNIWR